jgi:hypothetical protein
MKALTLCVLLALVGCANGPVPPDWQMNAHDALAASRNAYLEGNTALADAEFARARGEIARTARLNLLARAELTRCAARVASLEFDHCPGYAAVEADAGAAERSYAAFLAGRWSGLDLANLPAPYRALVAAKGDAQLLKAIDDPLSRLIAAGVLLQIGQMTPAGIEGAIEVASMQGWRRPLLAWLGVQAERAQALGDTAALARIRRRIALASGTGTPVP